MKSNCKNITFPQFLSSCQSSGSGENFANSICRKFRPALICLTLYLCLCSCSHNPTIEHSGERKLIDAPLAVDSIYVDADTTSLRGNFAMMDSSLLFVDQLYCRIYSFSLNDGSLSGVYSGYGQGPNEMVGIMHGSAVHPADTAMWIFDSSNGVYEFVPAEGTVIRKGRLDFSWDHPSENDYSSPSCYNAMEMSDFGLSLYTIGDSCIKLPVSLINRNLKKIDATRYSEGHIFGDVNTGTMTVDNMSGSFPKYYHDTPLPYFEFFDYAVDYKNSKIYVNHSPDSLIYCYDFDGRPVTTSGFEPEGVNREYTAGFETDMQTFGQDISHVGTNTGLYFDDESQLLFRTSMVDFPTGTVVMQVYKDNDLISESKMPPYFKLLGKYNGYYYGTRFMPMDDGNNSHFVIYRIRLPEIQ